LLWSTSCCEASQSPAIKERKSCKALDKSKAISSADSYAYFATESFWSSFCRVDFEGMIDVRNKIDSCPKSLTLFSDASHSLAAAICHVHLFEPNNIRSNAGKPSLRLQSRTSDAICIQISTQFTNDKRERTEATKGKHTRSTLAPHLRL
jgi:hypothetical protein